MPRICVFGDSIAWGSNDIEGGGWVDRLKRYYRGTGIFRQVFNLGISGRNSKDFIARFETELKNRMSPSSEMIAAIVASSVNDASYFKSVGEHQVPLEELKQILPQFKETADKLKVPLVIIGITNVGNKADKPPLDFNPDYFIDIEDVKKYNETIKKFCVNNKILFIDLFGLMMPGDLDDYVHPNTKGHEKIFEKVKKELIKAGIIE
ncbi:SGNH/GDSL hydrolase family protein [Candidatus Parcubacteria bacterium]|nr:SGNH/GDSL hydrolase family protein [Candidatus Parcubacteria bacterium]